MVEEPVTASRPAPYPFTTARLTQLVRDFSPLVWRTLRRLGVKEASLDDATQEVFIVLSRRLGWVESGRERSFVYSTAIRIAANQRRLQRSRREESLEELRLSTPLDTPGTEQLVEQKRMRELLQRVLDSMPDELREIFVLFELEGVTRSEMAEFLGLPAGTVASRLRRARELFEAHCGELRRLAGGGQP